MYSFALHDNIQVLTVDNLLDATDNQKIVEEVQELIKTEHSCKLIEVAEKASFWSENIIDTLL